MSEVVRLRDAKDVKRFGGKAANLGIMLRAGLSVPDGFVISIKAFDGHGKLKTNVTTEITELLDKNKLYAVRSSALAEDAEGSSWAGQFETFLDTKPADVIQKIEACHNSTKARARAYTGAKGYADFNIAVVVQEMLKPKYAGVSFTKNPSDGANQIITEYVRGLGEALVHGDADPERVVWSRSRHQVQEQTERQLPFPLSDLLKLAENVERTFRNVPQDIEWVYDGKNLWLTQSRPITTLQDRGVGKHYLGEPGKLFYWGPSRAVPLYMSDFMLVAERFFAKTTRDMLMPNAPKTIALFHEDKNVWLIKAAAFHDFVTGTFHAYEQARRFSADKQAWHITVDALDTYMAETSEPDVANVVNLLEAAWAPTPMAEFALYGAETVLHDRLARFDDKARQVIWGSMTLPDEPTFMQRVDAELAKSARPAELAKSYPWIQDGYNGVFGGATEYFQKRLKIVRGNTITKAGSAKKRLAILEQYQLKPSEIKALDLARELSVFMDDRKAWMMRTRHYIERVATVAASTFGLLPEQVSATTLERLATGQSEPYFGVSFIDGKTILLNAEDANLAWDWYVEFRASRSVLKGLVASSGGRHFMNGEVFVAMSPMDAMPDDAVLVVPSTSPSYVPLMLKARALVTDHGGMMSHAAIVAREFRLPSIVGTKQATKVLKTGDKVVLDLVTGEVNK